MIFCFFYRVCADEDEEAPLDQRVNQTRTSTTIPTAEIKTECDIDEYVLYIY
jgi:hypothetical protein